MKLLSRFSRVAQRRNFSSSGPENDLFCRKKTFSLQTISAQEAARYARPALCEAGAGLCANSIDDNGLQVREIFASPCCQLAGLITDQ